MAQLPIVICIDGPAGCGKSTVASKIANKLGFIHLNSGALFRAVALEISKQNIDLDNVDAIVELASRLKFFFKREAGQTRFFVDGQDLSERISSPEVGLTASKIAVIPKLRQVLLNVQRDVAKEQSVVVEGRDAGTEVFPGAAFKFFLDASLDVRTERRFRQISSGVDSSNLKTPPVSWDDLKRDLAERDLRDETREAAPVRAADNAIKIDTSNLSEQEVVEELLKVIRP
jgi:cytidylate kinase